MGMSEYSKNEISFYALIVGMSLTIISLYGSFIYSQSTDFCIIDAVSTDDMGALVNCKSSILTEIHLLHVGIFGMIFLAISTAVHVWERKSRKKEN